jgi:hypothetical protein
MAAKDFDIDITIVKKGDAGPDAKAPAVYLNDRVIAEIGGVRDGKITYDELVDELRRAHVPGKQNEGGCTGCCH